MATLTAPSGRRRALSVDMTPMVDLAFLLLTFFVLTTHLNKAFTLEIGMPHKTEIDTPRPVLNAARALTLVLGDQNKIHWYTGTNIADAKVTDFSPQGVRKLIAEKKASMERLFVLIKPSNQSQYSNVIDILDEMLIAQQKDFTIVDLDPLDEELLMH
jgi:biopolymer transport protein ExbD